MIRTTYMNMILLHLNSVASLLGTSIMILIQLPGSLVAKMRTSVVCHHPLSLCVSCLVNIISISCQYNPLHQCWISIAECISEYSVVGSNTIMCSKGF